MRTLSNQLWNPYDFDWGGDARYVADAAQNTLMRLAPGVSEYCWPSVTLNARPWPKNGCKELKKVKYQQYELC